MRIKKVKITNAGKISMMYEQLSQTGIWDEYSLNCSETARPDFYVALKKLAPHVVEMCELPNDYDSKIKVRGVSFGYGGEKEVMGATISAQMALEKSNCDLNINTPYKASDSYSDSPADDKQLLSGDCIDDLLELQAECKFYIKGERAQGRLFKDIA